MLTLPKYKRPDLVETQVYTNLKRSLTFHEEAYEHLQQELNWLTNLESRLKAPAEVVWLDDCETFTWNVFPNSWSDKHDSSMVHSHHRFNLDHEFWHRTFTIVEREKFNHPELDELNARLHKLRDQLKERRSFDLIAAIQQVIAEIKKITYERLMKLGKKTKSLRRQITVFFRKRNLRKRYRQIIQFLFKNMDDESGDAVIVFAPITVITHHVNKNHEIQKRSYRSHRLCT
jgi:hypothetical protein